MKSAEGEKNEAKVQVPGLSGRWNDRLTDFFEESETRTRIYWLISSLIRHQSVRTANAMAFDFFLALVPMLGLAGWATTLLVRSGEDETTGSVLTHLTPAQLDGFIGQHFQALAAAHLAPIAAIAGLWLSSSAFNTMISVFEETFECRPRSWLGGRLLSLGFALLGLLLLGLGGALGVLITLAQLGPGIEQWLKESGASQALLLLAAFGIITSFIALVYRFSIRRPGRKRRVWAGAFTASLIGSTASAGLGFYAANIARYALFYGGLAAIVIVLLWLWLWSSAILVGAELNIAMEDVAHAKRPSQRGTRIPGLFASGSRAKPKGHFAAEVPLSAPTQTPMSSGNSDGD